MWAEDLLPYRELHRQIPFAMVAHASYPEVTKDDLPASLSKKWMQDILRKKIGFKNLIISDDLEMGGVMAAGSIEEVTVETLRAGADMYLVCHNQELVWRGYEAVLREAEKNRKFAAHVAQAAKRVLAFKKRSPELRGFSKEPTARVIQHMKKVGGEPHQSHWGAPALIVAGVMSGTSADGIDVALVQVTGKQFNVRLKLLHHSHTAYPAQVRNGSPQGDERREHQRG